MAVRKLIDGVELSLESVELGVAGEQGGPPRFQQVLKVRGDAFLGRGIETSSEVDILRPELWAFKAIRAEAESLAAQARKKAADAEKMQDLLAQLLVEYPQLGGK